MKHDWLIELGVVLAGALFLHVKLSLIVMVTVSVIGFGLLVKALKNPMIVLRFKDKQEWKRRAFMIITGHAAGCALIMTMRCLLYMMSYGESINFMLVFTGYFSFLLMLGMSLLAVKNGVFFAPVFVAPGLLEDIEFPVAGIPIVDCLLETSGWNNASVLLLATIVYAMLCMLLFVFFMYPKRYSFRMRDLFMAGAVLAVLALRYGDYAPFYAGGQGFVYACCHMSVYLINRIEGGLAYVLPYVFLVFYAVDDVRGLRNNKAMVLTRLSGYYEYVKKETKILWRDILVSSLVFDSLLMAILERQLSLATLETCIRNIIIVGLFSEIFLVLLKWIKEQEAVVLTMAGMFSMCFSGMLAIYRQKPIARYNLFSYDIIFDGYERGTWAVAVIYVLLMVMLEILRRRLR